MNVTHTTKAVKDSPLGTLIEAAVLGSSGMIEAQEKRGQTELVHSELIPRLHVPDEQLLAVGFTLGPMIADDRLFRKATLPTGWKRRPSDHSMWSYIDDQQGRQRASIFYKAAFYDRDAHMSLCNRFHIEKVYFKGAETYKYVQHRVTDCGNIVFTSTQYTHANPEHAIFSNKNSTVLHNAFWCDDDQLHLTAVNECKAWLTENGFPDYSNPTLYW